MPTPVWLGLELAPTYLCTQTPFGQQKEELDHEMGYLTQ